VDIQLPVQSVHITSKVVSSSSGHGEMCSIQRYEIKFVGALSHSVVSSTSHHDLFLEVLRKLQVAFVVFLRLQEVVFVVFLRLQETGRYRSFYSRVLNLS
jgi:Na+/glutamate symporter